MHVWHSRPRLYYLELAEQRMKFNLAAQGGAGIYACDKQYGGIGLQPLRLNRLLQNTI
jgi:hypothetical protein